jgi:GAF domain-containing protein
VSTPKGDKAGVSSAAGSSELDALASLAGAEGDEIVERALELAREMLGMDLAYMTQFTEQDQVYRAVDGPGDDFSMDAGAAYPLEGSYCRRMVLGQIPNAVPDTAANDELRDLELTGKADIGAYVGVPITLSDGTLYGTVCVTSHDANPELAERDVAFMHVLARIIAGQLEQRRLTRENEALKGRVRSLKLEIDQAAQKEQVDEIADSDWFGDLSQRAGALRKIAGGEEVK